MIIDRVKAFVADIARPYAIISLSTATAASEIIIAVKVDGFEGAALFLAAAMTGVAGLYGAKSAENVGAAKHAASIEIAKGASPTAPATPTPETTP